MHKKKTLLVTFEGIEGSGKSYQSNRLFLNLKKKNIPVIRTREPGGTKGAEAEFGLQAERMGMEEVNFTFEGHQIKRKRGVRFLTQKELMHGDFSLSYISKIMNRPYEGPKIKKVLQSIWHQINNAEEVFVVGMILEDGTVKGGTGWGAEFAKLCNKPLYIFDQGKNQWFN